MEQTIFKASTIDLIGNENYNNIVLPETFSKKSNPVNR